ncbi:hypothetical protein SIN8267_01398 [Sinobacterium norvegicum]|uniref:Uncharacterized protein n=1 Tax=Sinobacterium norvegicum TaxID=1641715 RepID=A0ABM9AE19_9GAMM|nr:hypothetical protein SIN8267_01398 [Sinobacterium norvegicum]
MRRDAADEKEAAASFFVPVKNHFAVETVAGYDASIIKK